MIYFSLVLISPLVMFLFRKNENREKLALAVTCIVAFLLLALRSSNTGVDLGNYYYMFNEIKDYSFMDILRNFTFLKKSSPLGVEWGYMLLSWFFSHFNLGFQTFLAAESAFCIWSIYHFISKHSVKPSMSIIIIIAFGIVDYTYCILRQALSFAVLLFTTDFMEKRKYPIAVLLVLVSTFFHQSSIVLLPAVFLSLLPINWYTSLIFIVLSCLIIPLFPTLGGLVNRIMAGFDKETYFADTFEFGELIFILIAMALFMTFFYVKKKDVPVRDRYVFWAFMLAIPIESLAMYIPIFTRLVTMTLLPFASVAIPNSFIRKDEGPDHLTLFFEIAITVAVCLYYAYCLYFEKRALCISPYRFFFMK